MRPDIVLIDANWPNRALVRAQLIEEGYDVIATDDWATAKTYVEASLKPRLVVVDLQNLPDAEFIIGELEALATRDCTRELLVDSATTGRVQCAASRPSHILVFARTFARAGYRT